MPQQINLSTPVLLKQKRYFSARTMLLSLAVFVLLGGALTAYGVWSLNSATTALQATLDAQAPELASLRNAVVRAPPTGAAGDQALAQELQAARTQLLERQAALLEWRRGLTAAGQGHSARLKLVAQSIPPQVWVTNLRVDESLFEVQGFTEEPAALNAWVAKMASSPLLRGQQLARVKVEHAPTTLPGSVARSTAPAGAPAVRPVWSFTLASAATPAAAAGGGSRP